MTQNREKSQSSGEVDRTGPITLLVASSVGFQVNDMPEGHYACENDTFNSGSGDSDTV